MDGIHECAVRKLKVCDSLRTLTSLTLRGIISRATLLDDFQDQMHGRRPCSHQQQLIVQLMGTAGVDRVKTSLMGFEENLLRDKAVLLANIYTGTGYGSL